MAATVAVSALSGRDAGSRVPRSSLHQAVPKQVSIRQSLLEASRRSSRCRVASAPRRWCAVPASHIPSQTQRQRQRPSSAGAVCRGRSSSLVQPSNLTAADHTSSVRCLVLPPAPRRALTLPSPAFNEPARAIDIFMDRLLQLQAFEDCLAMPAGDKQEPATPSRSGGLRSFEMRERLKRPASASHVGRLSAVRSTADVKADVNNLEVAGTPSTNAERARPASAGATTTVVTSKTFSGPPLVQATKQPNCLGTNSAGRLAQAEEVLHEDALLGIAQDDASSTTSSLSPRAENLVTMDVASEALKGPCDDALCGGGVYAASLRGSLPRSAFAPPPPSPRARQELISRRELCNATLLRRLIAISLQRSADGRREG